ncbi:hypothetical protein K1719_037099 [Acacia pycnantha]|nr:hypothetical protein K1719_037099 [Acacia pycnantha]
MSFSPDRVRVQGRSLAFNALASTFENPNARNLSTPPPMGWKLYPKSVTPDSAKSAPKSTAIAALSSSFEQPPSARDSLIPRSIKGEVEDEEGLPIYPYERLKISSTSPVTDIDVTKRETYLSSAEFKEKFGMTKDAFYKLPKWKQNKFKMVFQLF